MMEMRMWDNTKEQVFGVFAPCALEALEDFFFFFFLPLNKLHFISLRSALAAELCVPLFCGNFQHSKYTFQIDEILKIKKVQNK